MRHLMGVILAIVMAAVLFFAGAWGYLRLTALTAPLSRLPAGGGSLLSDHGMLAVLVAVAGTGLLAGILVAAPRISPLAAGLPGLALLGWTAFYVVSARHAVHLIPPKSHPYGAGFEAMLFHGILGAAGLAMIIPLFLPSRWRARSTAGPAVTEDSGLDQIIGSQAPTESFGRVGRDDRKAGVHHLGGVRHPRIGAANISPVGRRSRRRVHGRAAPIEGPSSPTGFRWHSGARTKRR